MQQTSLYLGLLGGGWLLALPRQGASSVRLRCLESEQPCWWDLQPGAAVTEAVGTFPPRGARRSYGGAGAGCRHAQPLCFFPAGDAVRGLGEQGGGGAHGHVRAVPQQL